jgi:hypothetical protein
MADRPWLGSFFPPQKNKIAKKIWERHVGTPIKVTLTLLQQPPPPPITPPDNGTLDGHSKPFHWCCLDGNPPDAPPHCQPAHPSFCGPPTLPISPRPTVRRQCQHALGATHLRTLQRASYRKQALTANQPRFGSLKRKGKTFSLLDKSTAQDLCLTATDLQKNHGKYQWDDPRQWIVAMPFMAEDLHHRHSRIHACAAQRKPPPLPFGAEELIEAYAIICWHKSHQTRHTYFQLLQPAQSSSMYGPWASHTNRLAGVRGHMEAMQLDLTAAPWQPSKLTYVEMTRCSKAVHNEENLRMIHSWTIPNPHVTLWMPPTPPTMMSTTPQGSGDATEHQDDFESSVTYADGWPVTPLR